MRSREFLNLIIHDCKFLDGFLKISNTDQLITALKYFITSILITFGLKNWT